MTEQNVESILIRRVEPEDFRGLQRIHEQPRAVFGTLQVPYPSAQMWRQRLEQQAGNHYGLVACVRDTIVGSLALVTERSPRRSHVGEIGMAWAGGGLAGQRR